MLVRWLVIRGATFSHFKTMTDATGKVLVDSWVIAGPSWYDNTIGHIEVIGWNSEYIAALVEALDALSDDEWLCAYTLAYEDWHGTPEDLLTAAKELS